MATDKNFLHEIDFLGMSIEKSEQDKFLESLHYLNLGLKEYPDDYDLLLERAHVYSLMGVNNLALREYFFLLVYASEFDDVEEIYVGILQCFMMDNNIMSALYYLKKAIEIGALEQEFDIYESLVKPQIPEKPSLRLVNSDDIHSETLQMSKHLMFSGQYDAADKLLCTIPASSKQYLESCCLLSLLYVTQGDAAKGKEFCDKVLEQEPEDVFALSTKLIACDMLASESDREEIMARLRKLEITDVNQLGKVAAAMEQIGKDEEALFYLSKILKIKPYDREMLILCGVACAKCDKLEQSREMFSTALKINPYDKVAQYYNGEVSKYCPTRLTLSISGNPSITSVPRQLSKPDFSSFLYSLSVPREEAALRTQYIREKLTANKWSEVKNDIVLLEYIEWAFMTSDVALVGFIAAKLIKYAKWKDYMRTKLIDRELHLDLKKAILVQMLLIDDYKSFFIIVDDMIKDFAPMIPHHANEFPKIFTDCYWTVYAMLAVVESDFDSKLNSAFRKILAGLESSKTRIKNRDALCAVLTYMSKINKLISKKDDCIEVFAADVTTFNLYYELVSKSK